MSDLPPGWIEATFGELAELSLGKMLDRKQATGLHPTPYLRNVNVRWGTFDLSNLAQMDIDSAELDRVTVQPGDLVICEGGEPGRCAVWRGPRRVAIQKALHRVRPADGVSSDYLAYALRFQAATGVLARSFTGSTIKHLPKAQLRKVPVRVPPLAEQERIVAAIEEHFSHLDAAEVALSDAQRRSEGLRAAVLHEIWTSAGPSSSLSTALAERLSNGRSVRTMDGGFPVLRLTSIRDGRIIDSESKEGEWTADEAKPYLIHEGDFLVARGNGSLDLVGRGGLVGAVPTEVAYPDTMIRIRVDPSRLLPEFLRLVWDAPGLRRQVESLARTTAGIYKVNQSMLAALELPMPAVATQTELLAQADRALTAASRLTDDVAIAARRQTTLRSSVLAAAFQGELVPQEPSDAPASSLFDRIREKRAKAKPASRKRKAKTS